MRISITGTSEKIKEREIKEAAIIIYAHLVTERIHSNTNIDINLFSPTSYEKKDGLYGETICINENSYIIRLNKFLTRPKFIQTLAHELVHVKQYRKKQLGCSFEKEGKLFTFWKRKVVNVDNLGYYFTPWEIEANGKEHGLFRIYENYRKTKV